MMTLGRRKEESTPEERERVQHYTEDVVEEIESSVQLLQKTLDHLSDLLGITPSKDPQ